MSLVNYDVADAVALIQLDRPEARNAINTAMLEAMLGHLAERPRRTTRSAPS